VLQHVPLEARPRYGCRGCRNPPAALLSFGCALDLTGVAVLVESSGPRGLPADAKFFWLAGSTVSFPSPSFERNMQEVLEEMHCSSRLLPGALVVFILLRSDRGSGSE